jgi:hypothetical protein
VVACIMAVGWAVTIEDLKLTPEKCAVIRKTEAWPVCQCRLPLEDYYPRYCHPNCCPKTSTFRGDRCHSENKHLWAVWEQHICLEKPSQDYVAEETACYFRGAQPRVNSVTVNSEGNTAIHFHLSQQSQDSCRDVYVVSCQTDRILDTDMRLNKTTGGGVCWVGCPPQSISGCTEDKCWGNRGVTHKMTRTWEMTQKLPAGDYALTCEMLVQGEGAAVGSNLFQLAHDITYFYVPPS